MADLYNTDLGTNARKTAPTSLFGTRQLKFFLFAFNDYNLWDNYKDPDSAYSQVVRTIQETAELYYVSGPDYQYNQDGFIFAIAADTAEWQYSDQGNIDENEIGEDPTDGEYQYGSSERYIAGTKGGDWQGHNGQMSAINDLADRLYWFLFQGMQNSALYSDYILQELEDTGFGLMPGRYIYG